jgi:hypothetical protein
MSTRMTRNLVIPILALSLAACGGSTYAMRASASDTPPAAVEGRAVVIFAMTTGGRDTVSIVDELGQYQGQLRGHAWFVRDFAPGDHRFYALEGSSAQVVHATALQPGRVYLVRMEDPVFGSARFVAAGCSLSPPADTHRTEADPAASETNIQRQLGNVPQRALEADGRFDRMTGEERTARTLDGTCGEPAAAPTAPTPVASDAGTP